MKSSFFKNLFAWLLVTPCILIARDNSHFYRASYFFGEPRFEKPWLTSLDATMAGGSSSHSRSCCKDKTTLLNIYGLHNTHKLGVAVPGKDATNALDILLDDLAALDERDSFAQLRFDGTFKIKEAQFMLTQNLSHGFFTNMHVPVRRLSIKEPDYVDQSPHDNATLSSSNPTWQNFLDNFDNILVSYNLNRCAIRTSGIGDTTLVLGWTNNYQKTKKWDFVDTTLQAGVLIPTGKEKNEDVVFDLPLGYNGFYGVPVNFDMSFGIFDWITLGTHFDATFFLSKTKDVRMKTALAQNGFIKLAKGTATVRHGKLFNAGTYVKADHVAGGLSLLFAYNYAHKMQDSVTPHDTATFNKTIVETDGIYRPWKVHTLNFLLEYDFTKEGDPFGPRVGLFYNNQVGGKRAFNTNMIGANVGVEIDWAF